MVCGYWTEFEDMARRSWTREIGARAVRIAGAVAALHGFTEQEGGRGEEEKNGHWGEDKRIRMSI